MNTLAHRVLPLGMGGGGRMSVLSTLPAIRITQPRPSSMSSLCPVPTATSCICGISYGSSKTKGLRKSPHLYVPPLAAGIASSAPIMASAASSQLPGSSPVGTIKMLEGDKWDLVAGVIVERRPIVTQNTDDFQKTYVEMLSKLEFELSKKSAHELRQQNDEIMLEKVKTGEIDVGNVQTARDDEDRWSAELQSFEFGKRETDADLTKDTKSLERALDSHLLLLVEQKLGNDYRWICPHSKLEQGETLRQAAERMMLDTFPEMKTKILGNAPWGFYKYKYPKSDVTDGDPVGAKVFFYKAQIVSGAPQIRSGSNVKDFVWLKRDELSSQLQEVYYRKLSHCLIDE